MGLNERQTKIIKYIKRNKVAKLSAIKTIVSDASNKTLYRDLQDIVNIGLLKKTGEKKGTKYEMVF